MTLNKKYIFVLISFCILCLGFPQYSTAQQIPEHAQLDYMGHGWMCQSGFYQSGQSCLAVKIPPHAQLDYTGHGWMCQNGFFQQGNECRALQLPQNAQLDYTGHGWMCQPGYSQNGGACQKIIIPPNAQLDATGHNLQCVVGFKYNGTECVKISPAEAQAQQQLQAAIMRRLMVEASYSPCERAYRKCTSECSSVSLYPIENSDEEDEAHNFASQCDDACRRGRRWCDDESTDRCYEFKRACRNECPSFHNADCKDACHAGERVCE